MSETFMLPVVQYVRPDGRRKEGWMEVPSDVEDGFNLIKELGIEITIEVIFNEVNVCLDDGDFHYKFELWPNDKHLPTKVAQLVREFDVEDYEARKAEEEEH